MKVSFKFKIALISFSVSGALLTAFGVAFFAMAYSNGIDRVDRELRAFIEAPARADHPPDYWQRFGQSITFVQDEGAAERLALIVLDSNDRVLFQTPNARERFLQVERPEAPPASTTPSPRALKFLKRHDRDGDQRVSREEFTGPESAFDAFDRDGDGIISTREADQVSGGPGRRDFRSPPKGPRSTPAPINARFATLRSPSENWRVGVFRQPETTLIAAMDLDAFNAEVDQLRHGFMIAVPAGLIALGVMGWFLAGRAMKPIALIAHAMEGVTAKGLDKRVPVVGADIELERLARVSNNMLDRLEQSYHQAVRFSADAAHELQTPLTILQGELDNAIQSAETGSSEQQRYGMLLEELGNLKSVVQKLLLLAHADEGRLNLNRETVDLSALVEEAAEDMEIIADGLAIETRVAPNLAVSADRSLLNQVLRNMTSNAAKYATKNGAATLSLEREGASARVTLSNEAPPIPREDQPLLFERFHRVDKARTAPGSGLGLALAREIARAHGGDLALAPYANGRVSFVLTLPAAKTAGATEADA